MRLSPVIGREFQVQSRNRSNHWLRVCGGVVTTAVFLALTLRREVSPAVLGPRLFGTIHTVLLVAIWVFAPALTADCLSREKREGTLGLLFLAPITPRAIVAGKSLIHLLRALTIWLATVPVACIPFLLGGVGWIDGASALTLQLGALLVALAAGLLASALVEGAAAAVVLAEIIATILALGLTAILGFSFYLALRPAAPVAAAELLQVPILLSTGLIDGRGWSRALSGVPGPGVSAWLFTLAVYLLAALALALALIVTTSWLLKGHWRLEPLSEAALDRRRRWLAPRFGKAALRKAMRRRLTRNPVIWLTEHTATGRVGKWAWCAIVLALELPLFLDDRDTSGAAGYQIKIAGLILLGEAFASARSFREEQQSGVWELLMVSPLRAGELLSGRLWAIWKQFLPALLVLGCLLPAPTDSEFQIGPLGLGHLLVLSSFVAVPLVGLYLSMRLASFTVAWLATFAFAVLWPMAAVGLVYVTLEFLRDSWHVSFTPLLLQASVSDLAGMFWFWMAQVPPAAAALALSYRAIQSRTSYLPVGLSS